MGTNAASSDEHSICFEPFYSWHSEDRQYTLVISLKGFKKEQLKVQVKNSKDVLAIHGKKTSCASKPRHFRKEFDIPKDCAADEIQAKFSQTKGNLSIVMPRIIIPEDKIRDVAITSSEPEDKIRDVAITSSEPEDKIRDVAITSSEPEDKIGDVVITSSEPEDEGSVCGVKISNRRATTVAVVAAAVVVLCYCDSDSTRLLSMFNFIEKN